MDFWNTDTEPEEAEQSDNATETEVEQTAPVEEATSDESGTEAPGTPQPNESETDQPAKPSIFSRMFTRTKPNVAASNGCTDCAEYKGPHTISQLCPEHSAAQAAPAEIICNAPNCTNETSGPYDVKCDLHKYTDTPCCFIDKKGQCNQKPADGSKCCAKHKKKEAVCTNCKDATTYVQAPSVLCAQCASRNNAAGVAAVTTNYSARMRCHDEGTHSQLVLLSKLLSRPSPTLHAYMEFINLAKLPATENTHQILVHQLFVTTDADEAAKIIARYKDEKSFSRRNDIYIAEYYNAKLTKSTNVASVEMFTRDALQRVTNMVQANHLLRVPPTLITSEFKYSYEFRTVLYENNLQLPTEMPNTGSLFTYLSSILQNGLRKLNTQRSAYDMFRAESLFSRISEATVTTLEHTELSELLLLSFDVALVKSSLLQANLQASNCQLAFLQLFNVECVSRRFFDFILSDRFQTKIQITDEQESARGEIWTLIAPTQLKFTEQSQVCEVAFYDYIHKFEQAVGFLRCADHKP